MKNKKAFVNNVGDLAEAQRASFFHFLSSGIIEEITHFTNPFLTNVRIAPRKRAFCLVSLFPSELKLTGPFHDVEYCLKRDLSYTIRVYIKGEYHYDPANTRLLTEQQIVKRLLNGKTDRVKAKYQALLQKQYLMPREQKPKVKHVRVKQDIFFGEIPLMTEEGTFIINGCERIIVSQIIRSPGIYFQKEFKNSKTTIYTATIISNRGLWTKFIYDTCLDEDEIEHSRIYMKLNNFKRKTALPTGRKKNECDEKNKLFLFDLFPYFGLTLEEVFDGLKYPQYVSEIEEKCCEEASELDIADNIRSCYFNQGSACFSIGEIGRYRVNKRLGLNLPKEITYLSVLDFFGILDGLIELKYYNRIVDDIDDIKNKIIRSIGELLQCQLRAGFYRLQKHLIENVSVPDNQKIDFDLEPLSEPEEWIIDPRQLTYSIRDFFKTSQLSQFMDQTNPLAELTHKRRISVFGPNGLKRDHISTVIRDIHPSQYGRLCPVETPEGQNAGLIASVAMFARISASGALETPYFLIKDGKIQFTKSPIYLDPDQESEAEIAFCDFHLTPNDDNVPKLLSVKENDFFSVKDSKGIHFLTTSPLQIISLATSLIPFIEHDDANRALMGSNMQRQAVPLLYTQKAIVGTGFESAAILDSGMVIKNYSQGIVEHACSSFIQVKDLFGQVITYKLKKYYRSNQETSFNQRPIVWSTEEVFSGEIIADGPGTNDGELALGRNLTLAYMPWEGYNYEDAIVLSERLVVEDCLTSVHIDECETILTDVDKNPEVLSSKIGTSTKYSRRHLNKEGIVRLGSYVKYDDVLVGKDRLDLSEIGTERKFYNAIFDIVGPPRKDTSFRVPHGIEGRVIEIRTFSSSTTIHEIKRVDDIDSPSSYLSSSTVIRFYIAQIRKIQVGDKLAGRHGNKGIVSRILPLHDMPYLPDGRPVDILFNPLGVPSRMNVGQVFECLLGFAGEKLGSRFKVTPFDEVYGKEASRILTNQKLKEAAKKQKTRWIFHSSYPGKILLRDGRTGEFFDNPITVGKSYILKLIHLVEDKIHARATGPYAMITEQPLAGKAQNGGQRFGEMEVWALEAYGCSNTLQELLTIKSDDIDGRNDMYQALLSRKEMKKPTPSISETFLALIRELNALGLDLSMHRITSSFGDQERIENQEKDIFQEIETKLQLRNLLARKRTEQFTQILREEARKDQKIEKQKELKKQKEREKQKEIFVDRFRNFL